MRALSLGFPATELGVGADNWTFTLQRANRERAKTASSTAKPARQQRLRHTAREHPPPGGHQEPTQAQGGPPARALRQRQPSQKTAGAHNAKQHRNHVHWPGRRNCGTTPASHTDPTSSERGEGKGEEGPQLKTFPQLLVGGGLRADARPSQALWQRRTYCPARRVPPWAFAAAPAGLG